MKKAGIPIILVTVLVAAALLTGCGSSLPGGLITEEMDFTDFTRVEVEGTFEVEIVQADLFSITISADESFFDYIAVAKEGETLRIYLNPRHTFTDFTLQARALKAEVNMPALSGVSLSGASKGTVTGFKSTEDLSLNVSGASSLAIYDGEAGDTEFEVSGASKITGSIIADDVNFEVSGASNIDLEGSANNIIATASGASKLNLADFHINNVNVQLSGASEASLNIKGRLDCFLSAASRLYFKGNPTMGNVNVTGASTVKHQ